MCVIAVCASERLTAEQVAKMYQANPHGAGIAWRPRDGLVAWKKGLTLEQITQMCAEMPLPHVAHFRIPSCGGPSDLLTHPFLIQKDVPLSLEGETKGSVLFHNGHWTKFREVMLDAAVKNGAKLPTGRWSDSRSMAWMAAHFGIGMLEFINEKVVVFGPGKSDVELFGEHGWGKISPGIWVSNKGWEHEHLSGFNKPRQTTQSGACSSSAAAAKTEEDKEEPQSPSLALARIPQGLKKGKSGGASHTVGPLDSYLAAARLWEKDEISHNIFKKARRTYEKWCHKQRMEPVPKPSKTNKAKASVH